MVGIELVEMLEGKIPAGAMIVVTKHGSGTIELYGVNGNGFKIPIRELDNFIYELENTDQSGSIMLVLRKKGYEVNAPGNRIKKALKKKGYEIYIPGNRIQKVIAYLKEARSIGVKLAEYRQAF